jgi:heat-inducible transcriptional repressor
MELISIRGRQVLMVLVLVGGEIHQQILTLAESVSQEQLSATASRLTQLCQNRGVETMASFKSQLDALGQDVLAMVFQEMTRSDTLVAGEVYLDGLSNVLAEPEFSDSDDARRALRLLEERSLLEDLLARTVMTSAIGEVQVLIGGEGTWSDLSRSSMVLARYGTPGLATGTLGVLGPMRMPYGHTISTVRFVAGLLSDLVTGSLGD